MADINQVITLGIGTPSGIPEFLTFGLQIGAAVVVPSAPAKRRLVILGEGRKFVIERENRVIVIEQESRVEGIG